MELKIVTVVGARPQFIKAAMVSHAFERYNNETPSNSVSISEVLIHTGQHFHRNMSESFFSELDLASPKYNLGICNCRHGEMTGRMLEQIESLLYEETPDLVLVYGDTNSTLAGTLSAAKLHIPVGHVEAGLRSFNRRMPEEINRVVVDHVSTLLFCPTLQAVENLKNEGMEKNVHHVGDVMYDASLHFGAMAEIKSTILQRLSLESKSYCLVTIHRAENTDAPRRLRSILEGLQTLAKKHRVLLPIHPRTRKILEEDPSLKELTLSLDLIDPVGYMDMAVLERNALLIVTDSGGVQKEAYFFKVPCITLRDETEWTELVRRGCNIVVGADRKRFLDAVEAQLSNDCFPEEQDQLYGNGQAGREILEIILRYRDNHYHQ